MLWCVYAQAIGGTYMTMLNTISNMGGAWPSTAALYLVGVATRTACVPRPCAGAAAGAAGAPSPPKLPAVMRSALRKLVGKAAAEGACGCDEMVVLDGYVVTCVLCLAVGLLWYQSMKGRIRALQAMPAKAWLAAK